MSLWPGFPADIAGPLADLDLSLSQTSPGATPTPTLSAGLVADAPTARAIAVDGLWPTCLPFQQLTTAARGLEMVQRGCRPVLVLRGHTCNLAIWLHFLLPPSTLDLTCPAHPFLLFVLPFPFHARGGSPCLVAVAGHFTQPPVLQPSGVDSGASARRQPETLLKHADAAAYRN